MSDRQRASGEPLRLVPGSADDSAGVQPCPLCGSIVGETIGQAPVLLAVCDVLVLKALEKVGKMLARNSGNRGRARVAQATPWFRVHEAVQPLPRDIDKGLHGAWDVIPAMLDTHACCGVTSRQVERMVDSYVRDLLITGTAHRFEELRYRFERFLGIPLGVFEAARPSTDEADECPTHGAHCPAIEED